MTVAHWLYVIGVTVVIATMFARRNVVTPCIIFTFLIGWVYQGSIVQAVQTVFGASMAAAVELFSVFLIIGLMVAMLKAMSVTGADEMMVAPLKRLLIAPGLSYAVLALTTLVVALFFWPTPSVPLVGALLAPVAIKAGLPPIACAMSIALAGQGMALAGDVIIQGAPKLTATAAAVPVEMVLWKAGVLTFIAGVIALGLGYWRMQPEIKRFQAKLRNDADILDVIGAAQALSTVGEKQVKKPQLARFLAMLVPVVMALVIVAMIKFKILGGDATALLGGAAAVITVVATLLTGGKKGLDDIADCIGDGLVFAFRVMGPILPIAGFFFLGSPEAAAGILGAGAPGYLFDVGSIIATSIPPTGFLAGFGILILGMITGLDGSGFSGLPLVGTLAGALASGSAAEASTLAAIGQLGAVWTGGGTLVAWCTLVAVAGIVGVPVLDLVRKNLVPVLAGLFVATLFGILFF